MNSLPPSQFFNATNSILYFLSYEQEVANFLSNLGTYGGVYLFGGVLRDLMVNKQSSTTVSDIDLIVDTIAPLPTYPNVVQNAFGGYQCFLSNNYSINYWRLCDTLSFKRGYFECSLINLPKTTVFDINAICWGVYSGEVFEHNFFRALETKTISFNCTKYLNDFPALQVIRAVTYSQKLNFKLSSEIEDFIFETVRGVTPSEFKLMLGSSARRHHTAMIKYICSRYGGVSKY